jgi:hypothetical protein
MIYFIKFTEVNAIKIGTSDNVSSRLKALQLACPCQLELLGTIPGDQKEEIRLHQKFARFRLKGEWFRAVPELTKEIIAIQRRVNLMADGLLSPAAVEAMPGARPVRRKAVRRTCKRRERGEGSIYLRTDGRWVASLSMGYGNDGRRRRQVIYGRTKIEVLERLRRLQTDVDNRRLLTMMLERGLVTQEAVTK